jgi:hypothetical protein
MARPRFRVTGFARFLLMLVIVTPLAYLGASYINGEDGIENIRSLFRGDAKEQQETKPSDEEASSPAAPFPGSAPVSVDPELERLRGDLDFQTRLNKDLKDENEALKRSLWEKDQEIARLKKVSN